MASRGTSASTHGHDSETSKGVALRSPIIHAHLVRRPGPGIVGLGGATAAARRGRPKTKKSGSGESSSSPTATGAASSRSEHQAQQASTSLTNMEEDGTPRLQHSAMPIIDGITDHPVLSISPASTSASGGAVGDLEFKLKNAGSLSVSWGE